MNPLKHSNTNEELKHIAPTLAALHKYSIEETFAVPDGYFEKMHQEIVNHPFVKTAPDFVVPGLYFESLPEQIANHAFIAKQSPFVVPGNYFEQLASSIAQRAGIREVKSDLEAPEGYFDNLAIRIQDKIYTEQKRTKVFWLPQAPQYRLALVAAVVTGILVMVFYAGLFESSNNKTKPMAMAKVKQTTTILAAEDIQEYDESMLIEEIDQVQQVAVNNNSHKENTEISEYLIENDVALEDIAEEI